MREGTAPGAHGGDAVRVARSLGVDPTTMLDLSMSMNPFAPDVTSVVARNAGAIGRYPDPRDAERLLADAIGVSHERLVLTNGGAEAIALVAALQPAGNVVDPEFSLYRRHLHVVADDAPRWRSNPSNPLGRLAGAPERDRMGVDAGTDVWDEAFFPLATGRWTDVALNDAAVWRLGSLTKTWSCPGLRLGYAIAPDDESANELRGRRPEWSVNALALAVVEPLLELTDLPTWSRRIASLRAELAHDLAQIGFRVMSTEANWLLVDESDRRGRNLRTELMRHRVLVRDCANFGLPGTFRVAVPLPDDVERAIAAFRSVAQRR